MDPRMLYQLESQSKLHRVLVDGSEVFSSNILLEALQQFNQFNEKFSNRNVEFESVCTDGGQKS